MFYREMVNSLITLSPRSLQMLLHKDIYMCFFIEPRENVNVWLFDCTILFFLSAPLSAWY